MSFLTPGPCRNNYKMEVQFSDCDTEKSGTQGLGNENKIDCRFQRGPIAIFRIPNCISLTNMVFGCLSLTWKASTGPVEQQARDTERIFQSHHHRHVPMNSRGPKPFSQSSHPCWRELWWRDHTSVCFKRECVRQTPGPASVLVQAPWVIRPVKCVFTADYWAAECRLPAYHWKRPPNSWSVRQIEIQTVYTITQLTTVEKATSFRTYRAWELKPPHYFSALTRQRDVRRWKEDKKDVFLSKNKPLNENGPLMGHWLSAVIQLYAVQSILESRSKG